jgi:hypothetical protein
LCNRIIRKVGKEIADALDEEYKTPKTNRNYKGADTVMEMDITKYISGTGLYSPMPASLSSSSPAGSRQGSSNSQGVTAGSSPRTGSGTQRRGSLNSVLAVGQTEDARRSSLTMASASPEEQSRWGPLLKYGERLIKSGPVGKRNNYGMTQVRQLLLTDYPRLLYADPSTQVVKGEVECSFGQSNGVASVSNASTFEVKESSGRVYKFTDNNKTANEWVNAINASFTKPRSGST